MEGLLVLSKMEYLGLDSPSHLRKKFLSDKIYETVVFRMLDIKQQRTVIPGSEEINEAMDPFDCLS